MFLTTEVSEDAPEGALDFLNYLEFLTQREAWDEKDEFWNEDGTVSFRIATTGGVIIIKFAEEAASE